MNSFLEQYNYLSSKTTSKQFQDASTMVDLIQIALFLSIITSNQVYFLNSTSEKIRDIQSVDPEVAKNIKNEITKMLSQSNSVIFVSNEINLHAFIDFCIFCFCFEFFASRNRLDLRNKYMTTQKILKKFKKLKLFENIIVTSNKNLGNQTPKNDQFWKGYAVAAFLGIFWFPSWIYVGVSILAGIIFIFKKHNFFRYMMGEDPIY